MGYIVLWLVVTALIIWGGARTKLKAQTNVAWRRAAEELGGTFLPGDSRIVAHIDGTDVTVEEAVRTDAVSSTRVRAAARAPRTFSLRVTRATGLDNLARALGSQDVPTGDVAFDKEFLVVTNDPTTAKLWLHRNVRKRIHAAQRYAFELTNGAVIGEVMEVETNAAEIVCAVHAVVALADGRKRVLRAWRELARKHKGSVQPRKNRWATLEFDLHGVAVTIDTKVEDNHHYTTASAQVVGAALEQFVLWRGAVSGKLENLPGYRFRSANREAALALLDERVRRAIGELEPSEVRAEGGEVVVTLPGISIDPKKLEKASALAATLASSSARSPYR